MSRSTIVYAVEILCHNCQKNRHQQCQVSEDTLVKLGFYSIKKSYGMTACYQAKIKSDEIEPDWHELYQRMPYVLQIIDSETFSSRVRRLFHI